MDGGHARRLCSRIKALIATRGFQLEGHLISINVRMGISTYTPGSDLPEDALLAAAYADLESEEAAHPEPDKSQNKKDNSTAERA
ncbi:MAG: hypothetical protein J7M32_06670 [Deltaproteobacteria bacterium]|nr:hypothetical protein [Deltaproteobacteria bacterium]